MKLTTITIALALIASGVPAQAGAILMCNEWGCRSSPYLPPIPVPVRPLAIYSAPPRGGPNVAYGVPLARSPIIPPHTSWPQQREAYRSPPPPVRRAPPRPDAEAQAIESDIMDFCDHHSDEPFCGKLGSYLRKHPDRAPQ
jgi:hypothetical protein